MFLFCCLKVQYCPLAAGVAERRHSHSSEVNLLPSVHISRNRGIVDQQQLHDPSRVADQPTFPPSECGCYSCEHDWTAHCWEACFHGVVI